MNLQISIAQSQPSATSQIEIVTPRGLQPVSPRVSSETEAVGEAIFDQDLPEWVLADFRASGVPDHLMRANIRYFEGHWALEILTEHAIAALGGVSAQTSGYVTKPAQRILEKYAFIQDGAWAARGCTLDGSPAAIWQLKPLHPRKGTSKGFGKAPKSIKYETPQGAIGLPILPFVDSETAAKCCARWGIEQREGETFWQMIRRCNVPIVLTEGIKKALSLLTQGIPAIASRSITQWAKKGTQEPHEAIAQFCHPGRRFYIAFDRDEKLSTQRDVTRQACKLGRALSLRGAAVSYLEWDNKLGKGIDDVLAGLGDGAGVWLEQAIAQARSFKEFKKSAYLPMIERLNRLDTPVLRHTEGGYLPPLPDLLAGAICVVRAGTGAGKTTALRGPVDAVRARGKITLVLSPINSLGRQTAESLGLPHFRDFESTAIADNQILKEAAWGAASQASGIVLCPNSLHHMPAWFAERVGLIILDEANQVCFDLLSGGTLGDRLPDIYKRFADLLRDTIQRGGSILAMEAEIPQRAINLLQRLSGGRAMAILHDRNEGAWDCDLMRGTRADEWRREVLERLEAGEKLLIHTASLAEGRRLEQAIAARGEFKITRIDGKTNREGRFDDFFANPDQWIAENRPDALILSPSAKSGVSLTIPHFDRVAGYFSYHSTDIQMQMLARYRRPVPRLIYCPQWIMSNGDEGLLSARRIRQQWEQRGRGMAQVAGLEAALEGQTQEEIARQEAALEYLAESNQVAGLQKAIAAEALEAALIRAGHNVRIIEAKPHKAIAAEWRKIQADLDWKDAQQLAAAQLAEWHDREWAYQKLNSGQATELDEIRAQKIFLREQFPGESWDDPATCYQALFERRGAMKRGILLQAASENIEAAQAHDREELERLLQGGFKALHRLPKQAIRAKLIQITGVLALLEGSDTYSNQDERAIAIKKTALKYSREFFQFLRLQILENHTPVEICNKLLRKLGLKGVWICRKGGRGEQEKIWQVTGHDDLLRLRLLEARRHKLSESVDLIRIELKNPSFTNQIYGPNPSESPPEASPPPWLNGVPAAEHAELLQMMSEARQAGPEAIEAVEAIAASMRWEVA